MAGVIVNRGESIPYPRRLTRSRTAFMAATRKNVSKGATMLRLLSNRFSCKVLLAGVMLCLLSSVALAGEKATSDPSFGKKARLYEVAIGVKRDYKKAFRLYCLAVKEGEIVANYHLGMMYFYGRGVKRDRARAMGWFKRGAAKNDRYAKIMLKLHPTMRAKKDDSCEQFYRKKKVAAAHAHHPAAPKQIKRIVHQIAHKFSIDPELVLAVIRMESGFKVNALSSKNAQGLMQLIPSTAKRFGVKNVWDARENIRGGVKYLHWLLRYFDGDVRLVLAAYNAGEGAVKRYNGVPPYKETQRYVERIIATYRKTKHRIPPRIGA